MASTSKKRPARSPASQRKSSRPNNVNLHTAHNDEITVVGIGASAGGLNALQAFFDALPDETGMAFVVITHLHPEHESHMAELLRLHTNMQVSQVLAKVHVEPNNIYVIPPNHRILMTDSQLDIAEFEEPHGQRMPIDHFFRSLARAHPNSVAIILSGGGTDGSVGLKAIKEEGGLLMVQHPDEAEYDSMPRAAISTGLADVILGVHDLAEKLVELTQLPIQLPRHAEALSKPEQEILQHILAQVHARTGHDFSHYKHSTILRRIQRRMQLNGYTTLEAYLAYLRQNVGEAAAIFNDILIGVTNFFRDHESWEMLEGKVIPAIFEGKGDGEAVRVWSIGCSTGEEAYTLAILLMEHAGRLNTHHPIQVFASDIDETSLNRAREGLYPAAIEADVSAERLERFFSQQGNHYQVKRELRDVVLYTDHSLLRDPPFSRLDLISCRNLLIYLQREMQDNVFDIFHYALNPGGILFLGSAESGEAAYELFETLDKAHHIYKTKPWRGEHPHVPFLPLSLRRTPRPQVYAPPRPAARRYEEIPILSEQHKAALEIYGPPSVLVNEEYIVLHISETAGRYLVQPGGPITSDLLKLVRPELQFELRTALFQAFEKAKAVVSPPINVQFNGNAHRVVISVRPRTQLTHQRAEQEKLALVLFLEDELSELTAETQAAPETDGQMRSDALIAQLQAEIQHLREQLQSSVEEFDSSNEEMKAANEELQSINEEYRSATEELETSKEELQSVNEELQTVNNELKTKLEEISRAHNDLENLMSVTEIATLFLDREFRIQRFTSGMTTIFNLVAADRGRPVAHLTNKLVYSQFIEDAQRALRNSTMVEREVAGENGEWFLVRHRPYRTLDDRIEGVVTTFVNISEVKKAQGALQDLNETLEQRVAARTRELDEANQKIAQARDRFYSLFHANPVPTALTRLEDDVFLNVNVEFLKYFGLRSEEVIGHSLEGFKRGTAAESRPDFAAQVKREGRVQNHERAIRHPSGEMRTIIESVQYLEIDDVEALISTFVDITERARAEQQIRSLAYELTTAEQKERQRIAQILHDDLQQRIFAIQMQMSFLRDAYEKNNVQSFQADFPQLETWLAEAIQVTRHLSIDLSPPILHGEGLYETIIWLAAQMQEEYGLVVNVETDDRSTAPDQGLSALLFYTVREMLFNVVKHAGILEAAVKLEHRDHHLHVTVSDRGKGFVSEKVMNNPRVAHGLLTFRHRLNLSGANLEVKSEPGKGTQIVIEVPYERMET